jgi:dihydroflavonol-4-reductase
MKYQSMQKGDLCLVTGITGYLASRIGKYLVDEGYQVRGTVRSLKNVERMEKMGELLPGVEFVEADLQIEEGWTDATEGCKWVFHVASPQAVKSETDLVGSATKGTKYVMNAAFKTGTVKKIVITSSEAAMVFGHPSSKIKFNEDDWTNLNDGIADYYRSKTLAEKLAWDLVRDKTRNPNGVELSTVNPGIILGPSLLPWIRFSGENVKNIAEGKLPMLPDIVLHFVDVRDCARMHIAIMNDKNTNGNRHLSFSAKGRFVDIATVIRDNYSELGFAPSIRVAPKMLMWPIKFFVKDVASVYPLLGKDTIYISNYPNVYKYKYTKISEIIRDTMDNLIENKLIKPLTK